MTLSGKSATKISMNRHGHLELEFIHFRFTHILAHHQTPSSSRVDGIDAKPNDPPEILTAETAFDVPATIA